MSVKWSEFTSGLPLLEALNVGAIDVSADVADTVPVFAQAAGAKITYIAQETPSPKAEAVVVLADSPIKVIADLKGKKIAVTKAAGVHYLLIVALEKAGLSLKDVEPAYLTPGDARIALQNGGVAAWRRGTRSWPRPSSRRACASSRMARVWSSTAATTLHRRSTRKRGPTCWRRSSRNCAGRGSG